MLEKRIFAVVVNRDDTVRVVSIDVLKETPHFFITNAWTQRQGLKWDDPFRDVLAAFGTSDRIARENAFGSARAALENYMASRQRAKANALAVMAQATKQIASANELLMRLSDEPETVDAVDPAVTT